MATDGIEVNISWRTRKLHEKKNTRQLLVLSVFCEGNMAYNIIAKIAGMWQRNLLSLQDNVLNCST